MIERVADDSVLIVENCLEKASVRVETGRIKDRVFGAQKLADAFLELLVNGLRAADKAHRGHAVAVCIQRGVGRLDNFRMIGEAEIIIGAQVDDLRRTAIVQDINCRLLRAGNQSFLLEKPLILQCLGLLSQRIEKISGHGIALRTQRLQSISGAD